MKYAVGYEFKLNYDISIGINRVCIIKSVDCNIRTGVHYVVDIPFAVCTEQTMSEDEMDKLTTPYKPQGLIPLAPLQCSHNWATYIGFSDSFKFCTLCDKKE